MILTGAALAQPGQEARVAASALKIEPLAGEKKIQVSLRLLDAAFVLGAEARVGGQVVPVVWRGFEAAPPGACAWMIVVDTSNPARQRTVEACAGEVRAFLKRLPKGDTAMVATLARDLEVAAPFDAAAEQLDAALGGMRADGDGAFTSLIFQNVKHALADHLARRQEARRCVVLLTDGKDETPGGPLRVTERRNELIAEAMKLGIPVHTLGFAEKATEANYFADLKEISLQTDGLHFPAAVATRQLPAEAWPTLIGVMHSGGVAVLDLGGVKASGALRLELTCVAGQKAAVEIPPGLVPAVVTGEAAVPDTPPTPGPPAPAPVTPALPSWAWWAVGGVLLLLLIVVKARPGKPAAAMAPTMAEPQPPMVSPVDEELARPLVALEMIDGEAKRHAVTAKGVKIGSARHNDIVLQDDSVSADHGSLSLQNGEWVIADTHSVNGLRVNGTYYHQATLTAGDVIHMGEVRMRFLAEGA